MLKNQVQRMLIIIHLLDMDLLKYEMNIMLLCLFYMVMMMTQNVLIDERQLYSYDYLYFKENKSHTLHEKDILPKCNKDGNEFHSLNPIANVSSNTECRLCSRMINNNNNNSDSDDISFESKSCEEFLCKDCCHSLIINNMDEYKGQSHYSDVKLDVKTTRKRTVKRKDNSRLISFFQREKEDKIEYTTQTIPTGMQLWRIPKSGKYKVICYGAKGGDSTSNYKHLSGGFGSKVGSIFKLFENDIIKIVSGQKGQDGRYGGGGGGGGSYFILYKIGNKNPNYNENKIVNIPLCIAAGGNGACGAFNLLQSKWN